MSATDEPLALSTRLTLAAGVSAAAAYLHGLMGAVLAERHIEHIADWAEGVAFWLVMGAVWLAMVAWFARTAECELEKARLHADNISRWERCQQAQLSASAANQTESGVGAEPRDDVATPLESS